MNFTANDKRIIILHRPEKLGNLSFIDDLIVVLTPRFYTFKKEKLPVRFAYQAKRIAPSIFDGLLEEGKTYRYVVEKLAEGDWGFIAYDPEEIVSALQKAEIPLSKVKKVLFSQSITDELSVPVAIDDMFVLSQKEGVATVAPRSTFEGVAIRSKLPLEALQKKKGIGLDAGSRSSWLDAKSALVLSVLLIGFAVVWFAEAYRYNLSSGMEQKLQQLVEENPVLANGYKREAILEKYRVIDSEERAKREAVFALSDLSIKGVRLKKIELEKKTFSAVFELDDEKVLPKIRQIAHDLGFEFEANGTKEAVVRRRL